MNRAQCSVVIALTSALVASTSVANDHQDRPDIRKGQLLPAPQILRSAKIAPSDVSILDTIFEEHFETGGASWSTIGLWAIGTPAEGSENRHGLVNCAATNLSGNYANNSEEWLISHSIPLPELTLFRN